MTAILVYTGMSTILVAVLSVAIFNVMVRREASNVVEKQIELLLQTSRSVAPALLDHAGACLEAPPRLVLPRPLLAYTAEAFPQARTTVTVSGDGAPAGFSGLVVDRGQVEIRHVMSRHKGDCHATLTFSLPLGAELAQRLSAASGTEVTAIRHSPFRVHPLGQRILQTIYTNFIPGTVHPASLVLKARNWQTGSMEDWIAYSVRGNYANTFQGVAHLGSQVADWVWLLSLFSVAVILLEGVGIWRSVRLGKAIAAAVDDLSVAAGEIAGSNFAWRTAVRGSDQLAELTAHFNDMAIALERNQKAEASRLRLDGELHAARTVQESLYPRREPSLRNASVAGRTSPARMIGGDLYDFFDLGAGQTGLLCADVSGKGIPAALMMANLQALARAGAGRDDQRPLANPAAFVEKLNRELAGRFGDNRYATLLWCVYEEKKGELAYVGAGHPAPIVIHANGELERLESDGFPVGMFANSCYHSAKMSLRPGSRVVIFTDGVTDAADPAGEEYGETRLLTFCRELEPGLTAGDIAGRLMQAVAAWAGGAEQFDDTTVVVLSVAP